MDPLNHMIAEKQNSKGLFTKQNESLNNESIWIVKVANEKCAITDNK